MDELPYWRVVMRRERDTRRTGSRSQREHADAIVEMRAILQAAGTSATATSRWRPDPDDNYRGRKDSALALYYLWRIGEVMADHRERFERVYALTEPVAPPEALREVDADEADDCS